MQNRNRQQYSERKQFDVNEYIIENVNGESLTGNQSLSSKYQEIYSIQNTMPTTLCNGFLNKNQ